LIDRPPVDFLPGQVPLAKDQALGAARLAAAPPPWAGKPSDKDWRHPLSSTTIKAGVDGGVNATLYENPIAFFIYFFE